MDSPAENVLTGGNVASRVVRVGATVRKPATEATAAVEALLVHLAEAGFDGSPRSRSCSPSAPAPGFPGSDIMGVVVLAPLTR